MTFAAKIGKDEAIILAAEPLTSLTITNVTLAPGSKVSVPLP
jgi:predicted metal-dependent enzyme (double-stranded beta helix superfamily)